MAVSIRNVCSAVTLLALLCSCVEAAYFYNRDAHQTQRTAGYYSSATSPQHHTLHHKHHGGSNRRLQQAGVGIVSRGRIVPYTASPITTTPSSKLSPLDRLINRLDSEGRKSVHGNHQSHVTRFDEGNGRHETFFGRYPTRDHGSVSSSVLRSSADHRYAHLRSNNDDSYKDDDDDDDEDDDDDYDVIDDGENREDEDDDEADERSEEEEERLSRGRHGNHRTGSVVWVSAVFVLFSNS